ncbi:hypothetical protein AAMO2058_000714100 [Amorphochlora amoebiformis]
MSGNSAEQGTKTPKESRRRKIFEDPVGSSLRFVASRGIPNGRWPKPPEELEGYTNGYESDESTSSSSESERLTLPPRQPLQDKSVRISMTTSSLTPYILPPKPEDKPGISCSPASYNWHSGELEYQLKRQLHQTSIPRDPRKRGNAQNKEKTAMTKRERRALISQAAEYTDQVVTAMLVSVYEKGFRYGRGVRSSETQPRLSSSLKTTWRAFGWEAAILAAKAIRTPPGVVNRALERIGRMERADIEKLNRKGGSVTKECPVDEKRPEKKRKQERKRRPESSTKKRKYMKWTVEETQTLIEGYRKSC